MRIVLLIVALSCFAMHSDAQVVTTSYASTLQPNTPATGWSYLWNSGGAIGNPALYSPLLSYNVPFYYTFNGGAPFPPMPLGGPVYAGLSGTTPGGHPGFGSNETNGGLIERFMIAKYTLTISGDTQITNGLLTNADMSTDGLRVLAFVGNNPNPVISSTTSAGTGSFTTFSATDLGFLPANTDIYVAIGSRVSSNFDTFTLDYTITTTVPVPEPNIAAIAFGFFVAIWLYRRCVS